MDAKSQSAVATNPTELLTLPEASNFLGLTVWQLRGLISNRLLPIVITYFLREPNNILVRA
jgi:hypothetical protein